MSVLLRKAGILGLMFVFTMSACQNKGVGKEEAGDVKSVKTAGSEGVTLLIQDAALIQVDSNPGYNTAEWQFFVDKAGRYDVWLSSLTCDTSHLRYDDDVIITAGDTRLEKIPVGDEIVKNDRSVKEPWYRADSHMGSIFFSKPGEYQVQVISDRVEPHPSNPSDISIDKHTLINSVILKPMVN